VCRAEIENRIELALEQKQIYDIAYTLRERSTRVESQELLQSSRPSDGTLNSKRTRTCPAEFVNKLRLCKRLIIMEMKMPKRQKQKETVLLWEWQW